MKHPFILMAIILAVAIGGTFWIFQSVQLDENKWIHLISLVLILAYLLLALFSKNLKIWDSVKYILAWVGVGLILILGYAYRYELHEIKERLIGELSPTSGQVRRAGVITFAKAEDGHYYIDAVVNGIAIRFMVDTGASRVVLTARDAKRLGYETSALDYVQPANTANGTIWSAPVTLTSIEVGNSRVVNVQASVSESDLDVSLLGMSYLEKLQGYKVDKGGLTLLY